MPKYSIANGKILSRKRQISNDTWGVPVGPPKICHKIWYIKSDKRNLKPPKK